MRRLGTLLLLLAGCGSDADLEASRLFEEANRTFEQARTEAEFLRAAAAYESLLEKGYVGEAVLYNMGNAYLKAGREGRAIAAYRRAKRYRPRDAYLAANLDSALAVAGVASVRARGILDHVLFWHEWTSYREKALLFCAVTTLAFLLGLSAVLWRRYRKPFRVSGAALCIAGLALGLSLALAYHEIEVVDHGVVVSDKVVARKGNSQTYDPAFTEPLREGTEFTVIEERGTWLNVRLEGGLRGWIPRSAAITY